MKIKRINDMDVKGNKIQELKNRDINSLMLQKVLY